MLNWNGREMLCKCLNSLELCMPKALQVETFVVDNGSQDGSLEAVKRQFPWVKPIALPRNMGFAAGCNAGIRQAKGRYFLLLNNDTLMQHKLIERCVRHLDGNPTVGITGPILYGRDGLIQNPIHNPGKPCKQRRWFQKTQAVSLHGMEPIDTEFIGGGCMFIRPEVLENGSLPEAYFFYFEDSEICYRYKNQGGKITLLPNVSIHHVGGATSGKFQNAEVNIEHRRSLYLFLRRNYGRITAARSAIFYTFTLARRVLLRAPTIPFASAAIRTRWRKKCIQLEWHLRGCPPAEKGWGIPRN